MAEPGGPESHDNCGTVVRRAAEREDRSPTTARTRAVTPASSDADSPVAHRVIRDALVRTGPPPRRKAG